MLLTRILNRYLNVRSKEFLRSVKEKLKTMKSDALRQELTKKKQRKCETAGLKSLLEELIEDTTASKIASHLKLKARALQELKSFMGYSKAQLSFLFLLYGIKFEKSKQKSLLCSSLVEKIKDSDSMICPEAATKDRYDMAMQIFKSNTNIHANPDEPNPRTDTDPVQAEAIPSLFNLHAVQEAVHDIVPPHAEAETTRRRKRFKPTKEQIQRLVTEYEGHAGAVPDTISRERAVEFGVDVSQVKRWFSSYAKKISSG